MIVRFLFKMLKFIIILLLSLVVLFYFINLSNYDGISNYKNKNYGKVSIYRDKYGIPHIEAENIVSAIFGQGYAQA
jgi:acyl-homoserine lactone acylase PvdQ